MADAIGILLVISAVMFCIGVVCGILSVLFTLKKIRPVLAIILSIVCWIGLSVTVNMTAGFFIGRLVMILLGAFVGIIIAKSTKNMKQNKK
ncbi:MAG: hypothetical protein IJA12_03655 [Oscillospiraceae bacterium]|nr:hypothetical protein [Oscillospiraceae bacterium]